LLFLGFFYRSYLLPSNTIPVIIPSPTTNQPVLTTETCTTQRVYGHGYSFCLPANHTIAQEEKKGVYQKTTLISTITWDTITINQNFSNTSYTDSDSKFGDVTVSYNPEKKIWEAKGECDSPKNCNPSFYTKQGIQVFVGRGRWLTYIVPLDNVGVVVMNSTGGGFTGPLEELIQTVRKEKQ